MEYHRYASEFASSAAVLTRQAGILLALWPMALGACDRQPDRRNRPDAPAAAVQHGVASYYAPELAGRPTASGEPFRPRALTAASRSLPLGATAKVTNTENGQTVTVEVNDRGPYAKNRILDVSPRAAEHLGMKDDGVAQVAVQQLQAPSQTP